MPEIVVMWGLIILAFVLVAVGGWDIRAAEDSPLGVFFISAGTILLVFSFSAMHQRAQLLIPKEAETPSLNGQALRLMGKVWVDNACGTYVVIARKEDGTLVDFCTSQNVPGPIFKVTYDKEQPSYTPYAPFGVPDRPPKSRDPG